MPRARALRAARACPHPAAHGGGARYEKTCRAGQRTYRMYVCMYLLIRATGGIRLTASGPVLVQQPAAAGRVVDLAAVGVVLG